MRSSLFWDVAQRRYFIYRRFGTTYRSHLSETLISPIFNGPAVIDLDDGTDKLCRNVGAQLPIIAAYYPKRAETPETTSYSTSIAEVELTKGTVLRHTDKLKRHLRHRRL
jgi:hypothetical protein